MKKKLVIITEALGGGVRRHVLDLLMNLDTMKFDIYFLYGSSRIDSIMKSSLKEIKNRGIELIEIDSFSNSIGLHDIKAFKNIYKEIKKICPDIVHCHSSKAGALGRIVAKLQNIKQIYYTPHAYVFQNPNISKKKKYIYITVEKFLNKFATTKTINVSKGEKAIAIEKKIGNKNELNVIYNGISSEIKLDKTLINKTKAELNIDDSDIVIGNIARVDNQKDPFAFIDVARRVCENSKVKFMFVGNGELLEECKILVSKYELEDKVIFTGFREDVDYIVEIFDIFFTTSLYEGMPYSLIEALRAGLPIVATNIIGNNEIVVDGKNGYLYEIGEYEKATNILNTLVKDREQMNYLGKNSLLKLYEQFDVHDMIKDYEKLYENKLERCEYDK